MVCTISMAHFSNPRKEGSELAAGGPMVGDEIDLQGETHEIYEKDYQGPKLA